MKTHAESSVPDELRDHAESPGNPEEDGVEVLLMKAVAGSVRTAEANVLADTYYVRRTPECASTLGHGSVMHCQCMAHGGQRNQCLSSLTLTLRLARFKQDIGDYLVDLSDELEERVIGKVLECELSLRGVSGVLC